MAAEREGVAFRVMSWVVPWLMREAVLPMPSAFVRPCEKEPVRTPRACAEPWSLPCDCFDQS